MRSRRSHRPPSGPGAGVAPAPPSDGTGGSCCRASVRASVGAARQSPPPEGALPGALPRAVLRCPSPRPRGGARARPTRRRPLPGPAVCGCPSNIRATGFTSPWSPPNLMRRRVRLPASPGRNSVAWQPPFRHGIAAPRASEAPPGTAPSHPAGGWCSEPLDDRPDRSASAPYPSRRADRRPRVSSCPHRSRRLPSGARGRTPLKLTPSAPVLPRPSLERRLIRTAGHPPPSHPGETTGGTSQSPNPRVPAERPPGIQRT